MELKINCICFEKVPGQIEKEHTHTHIHTNKSPPEAMAPPDLNGTIFYSAGSLVRPLRAKIY